jgi:hypothetical protein
MKIGGFYNSASLGGASLATLPGTLHHPKFRQTAKNGHFTYGIGTIGSQ